MEKIIRDYFLNHPDVEAVYLFGSHASGKERSDSDVDVAILFGSRERSVINELIDECLVDLSRLLKKDIHPVALNHAGEELLAQIFNKGKCIVANDQRQLALFRVAAFAKIFDFSRYRHLMQSGLIKSVVKG